MKKFVLALALVLALAPAALAIPTGTIAPEAGRINIGGDVAFGSRDLDVPGVDHDYWTIAAEGSYGITDQFEVYLNLGMANSEISGRGVTIDGDNGFLWGVGARAVLYDDAKWFIKGMGGYQQSINHDGLVTTAFGTAFRVNEYDVSEWQVAVLGGMHFNEMFSPYIGIEYSDVDIEDLESDDVIGVIVGGDVELQQDLYLNLEGHFIDQTAGNIGLTYRFW